MSSLNSALIYILEKAAEEPPAKRASLYEMVADLAVEADDIATLNEAAAAIRAVEAAQLKLNLLLNPSIQPNQ